MVKKEEVEFLDQVANSLQKAELRLEEAYKKRDYEEFSKLKNFILNLQEKILEVI